MSLAGVKYTFPCQAEIMQLMHLDIICEAQALRWEIRRLLFMTVLINMYMSKQGQLFSVYRQHFSALCLQTLEIHFVITSSHSQPYPASYPAQNMPIASTPNLALTIQ